jgi:hypothetical protein
MPDLGIRKGLNRVASDGLFGLVVNVVPGLAHLIRRRFKEVRFFVLLWAVLLSVGLFLYGSGVGYVLLGLAIGLHAWIAISFGLFKEVPRFIERCVTTLIVVACFALLYWGVPRIVFRGYTGGYTALTIPEMRIEAGDYLLVRRTPHVDEPFRRGTLVLIRPARIYNERVDIFREQPSMIGQIVGLPGETLKLAHGFYAVGDEPLDPERFPVPRWLEDQKMTVFIRPGQYFVSSAYTVRAQGNARLTNEAIRTVCLLEGGSIQGRAFMRWWPLGRRGFIE